MKQISLTIFSNNAAGLTSASKKLCLKSEINFTNAAIFTIQETCFKKKGKFQLKGFEIFEAIRKKEKGGIMIGVHETLKPILIAEYDDEYEVLVVEIKVSGKEIRLITGVGPHENKTEDIRMPFFTILEKEITKAEMEGKSVMVEIDGNSKLGPNRIPKDIHPMSPNGRLLAAILDRHALYVVNSSNKCEGTITRKRVTTEGVEESTIDFMIVSDDLIEHVDKLIVDEERKHALTKIVKNKKKVESDHNPLITTFKMTWNKSKVTNQNSNMFNIKNRKGQHKFNP